LVTNGRHYSLLPAGEFQPASIAIRSIRSDRDLWRNSVREYSEEMLGQPEHDGSSGTWWTSASLTDRHRNVLHDLCVTGDELPPRRPQWRGERKAVLVRMPVDVADQLAWEARTARRSVSDQAADLITRGLNGKAG
jgi:hypothetical protein